MKNVVHVENNNDNKLAGWKEGEGSEREAMMARDGKESKEREGRDTLPDQTRPSSTDLTKPEYLTRPDLARLLRTEPQAGPSTWALVMRYQLS